MGAAIGQSVSGSGTRAFIAAAEYRPSAVIELPK
jgi:hypothetical protein